MRLAFISSAMFVTSVVLGAFAAVLEYPTFFANVLLIVTIGALAGDWIWRKSEPYRQNKTRESEVERYFRMQRNPGGR